MIKDYINACSKVSSLGMGTHNINMQTVEEGLAAHE